MDACIDRALPGPLEPLTELALDLRWCGCRDAIAIWSRLDPETWTRTRNGALVLANASDDELATAARDPAILASIEAWTTARAAEGGSGPPRGVGAAAAAHPRVAYFSMEFGLDESLPIYSGGLGVLAGDHLKSASDLGLPVVGLGILYQHGSFRQELAEDGTQLEARPYNDASTLPVRPLRDAAGRTVRIRLPLPGRVLFLRAWEARVGRVRLLLLDANDPMNGPRDRAVTAELYTADPELRLQQELVLGFGGWRLLETLGIDPEVCHLNEGHAAFAVVARAAAFARRHGIGFQVALRATRAGTVFTTHTPVAAAFDRFPVELVARFGRPAMEQIGVDPRTVLRLGHGDGPGAPFETARLALAGAGHVNGVSRLHGRVSRHLFAPLFPRVPVAEVPIGHVTNGVDVRTWIGPAAQELWREAGALAPWRHADRPAAIDLADVPDERLWAMRTEARRKLVRFVRRRMARWARERGASEELVRRAAGILDPDALTLGFARRFTGYKRPTLLLRDPERLRRLLLDPARPVQLLVAGKAHPHDGRGRGMVREMARFAADPELADRVVFLPDHDMTIAANLVAGVDCWLNVPRRPAEACGTSGMKILANGGLHCSVRDGWWDEAYEPDVGWAIGDEAEHGPEHDAADAHELLRTLEDELVPMFQDRDHAGIPRAWLTRVRASMSRLTPRFDAFRMARDYVEGWYRPAAAAYRARAAGEGRRAAELEASVERARVALEAVQVVEVRAAPWPRMGGGWAFVADVRLGPLAAEEATVELYADPATPGGDPLVVAMEPVAAEVDAPEPDLTRFRAVVRTDRPAAHLTVRAAPRPPADLLPVERPGLVWAEGPATMVDPDAVAPVMNGASAASAGTPRRAGDEVDGPVVSVAASGARGGDEAPRAVPVR